MAGLTTTSTGPTNSIGARYTTRFQRAAHARRLYDQFAVGVDAPQFELESRRGMGSSYVFNFPSDMTIQTSAISETSDITPQQIIDATSTISPRMV